jgi:hypothetical protein
MIVTSMGMAVSTLSSYTYCTVLDLVPSKVAITWKDFVSKIAPVGFFMAVTMHTGNEAYLHLSLSFIQVSVVWHHVVAAPRLTLGGPHR